MAAVSVLPGALLTTVCTLGSCNPGQPGCMDSILVFVVAVMLTLL